MKKLLGFFLEENPATNSKTLSKKGFLLLAAIVMVLVTYWVQVQTKKPRGESEADALEPSSKPAVYSDLQEIEAHSDFDEQMPMNREFTGNSVMNDFLNEKSPITQEKGSKKNLSNSAIQNISRTSKPFREERKNTITPKEKEKREPEVRKSPPLFSEFDPERMKSKFIVPYGKWVLAVLITPIESNNFVSIAEAMVISDVWHGAQRLIPFGTSLFGTVQESHQRDRVLINFDKMRLLSGQTFEISGLAYSYDKSMGVRGNLVSPENKKVLLEISATFIAAASIALQETETNSFGETIIKNNSQNAIKEAIAQVANSRAEIIREEANRLRPYLVIPAGEPLYMINTQEIDIGHQLTKSNYTYMGTNKEALWFSSKVDKAYRSSQ